MSSFKIQQKDMEYLSKQCWKPMIPAPNKNTETNLRKRQLDRLELERATFLLPRLLSKTFHLLCVLKHRSGDLDTTEKTRKLPQSSASHRAHG